MADRSAVAGWARVPGWVIAALVLPWVLLWPAPLVFTSDLLSGRRHEAVSHLWGLWAAVQSRNPLVVDTPLINYPDGFRFVLIDPGNLPPFIVGSLLGPVAGYNAVLVFGVALMGVAGALLGRAAGVDARGQTTAAVAAACCPALLSNAGEGITESFSVGWCGVAAAALLLHLGDRGWRWGALAGFALGFAVWGGPYNALWSAFLCGAIGLWHLRDWRRTLPVGLLGVVIAAPALASQSIARMPGLPGTADRAVWMRPTIDPTVFRGGNLAGADLLDPLLPGWPRWGFDPDGHTAYLGIVAVGLALLAVYREPRRWPWLAGAAAFVVLSLGLYLTVGGEFITIGAGHVLAPMGWLARVVPTILRFTRFYRAAAVAGLLLSPLVAMAVTQRRWWVHLALVLDACLLAPRQWPIVHFDGRASPVYAALPDDGPVVDLPPVQYSFLEGDQIREENLLQQVWHRRPNASTFFNLSGGASASDEVTRLMLTLIHRAKSGPDGAFQNLADYGYRYVVLDRTRFVKPDEAGFTRVLGDPVAADAHYVAWRLPPPKQNIKPAFPEWIPTPAGSPTRPDGVKPIGLDAGVVPR